MSKHVRFTTSAKAADKARADGKVVRPDAGLDDDGNDVAGWAIYPSK